MIETELVRAVGVFVEETVKDLRLPMLEGDPQPIQVYDGYLQPKGVDGKDEYPFIVVRAQKAVTEQESTVVSVDLIIGCYTTETDGYARCLEVMQRLRTAFCQLPGRILADRYPLVFPIEWNNLAEQPYPQWQTVMTTQWLVRTPQFVDQF